MSPERAKNHEMAAHWAIEVERLTTALEHAQEQRLVYLRRLGFYAVSDTIE